MNGVRLTLFGYVVEVKCHAWCTTGYYSAPPPLKLLGFIELFRWEAQ